MKSAITWVVALVAVLLGVTSIRGAEAVDMKLDVDWSGFMSRHDLIWERLPKQWYEAPFLGNGTMGTMVRQIDATTLRWDVGHGKVQDHRSGSSMYGRCRLPIGYFDLKTAGTITGGTMRLDLWNAEATGEVTTDKGVITWRSRVLSDQMVIIAEIDADEGEAESTWHWHPLPAISPRHASGRKQEGYRENPSPTVDSDGAVRLSIQPLLVGGETVTAWQISGTGASRRLAATVAHSFPGTTARASALATLRELQGTSMPELLEAHRAWWHAYYPASFVSIPDAQWESHYWIQMYKLASATRPDGMLIDNQGPWLQPTPWPGAWWNLNVQLSYWPTYDSNRLELGESLTRTLYSNMDRLVLNVAEAYRADSAGIGRATGQHCDSPVADPRHSERPAEIGNLLWACHNCWLHYRHTMDDAELRENLFPLLKRAVNYHLHFVSTAEDGKLHLPRTYSPEYNYAAGPDCNFDLALLRWGCEALIQTADRLGIKDPLLPKWQDVIENLVDYPTDENGYMIASGVPFARGHRHFSHLLMLYPLHLVNSETEGGEEVAVRSVDHWQGMGSRLGYSQTGASLICSAFGRGNDALKYLDGLKRFFQPNTLYKEAGPVIETPLSGAQCIHEMLMQSWGDRIRVFPAVPDVWQDVSFHDLRAQGAFLVSATRKEGCTQFVRVKSLAGEPCRLQTGFPAGTVVKTSCSEGLKEVEPGIYDLDIRKGEEMALWMGDIHPDLTIAPVQTDRNQWNSFGMK